MLGREGPSIQLGAVTAKGVSVLLKSSEKVYQFFLNPVKWKEGV